MSLKYLLSFGLIVTIWLVVIDRIDMRQQRSRYSDLTSRPISAAVNQTTSLLQENMISEISGESEEDKFLASKLDNLNLKITLKGSAGESEINHCKATIYQTFSQFPKAYVQTLRSLVLSFDPTDRRGFGSWQRIKLRCRDLEDEEVSAVIIHEIGHLFDLGGQPGHKKSGQSEFKDGEYDIYNDDPSLEFYRLSWLDEKTVRVDSSLDFITNYAKTDAFEDFAESFVVYRLHGPYFRELSKYNHTLAKKYDFMKNKVFAGQEFDLEEKTFSTINILERTFDATVMPYNWPAFIKGNS